MISSRETVRAIKEMSDTVVLLCGGRWKIGDFGYTKEGTSVYAVYSTKQLGTSSYRAPELLQFGYFRPAVDVWALGCIFYEMVMTKPLFRDDWETSTYAQNPLRQVPRLPALGLALEAEGLAQACLTGALNTDPIQRITVPDLIQNLDGIVSGW